MNLTVLGNRVFIRPDKLPELTSDGLLHIVHDRQESLMMGVVVAVGDGPDISKRAANAAFDAANVWVESYEPGVGLNVDHLRDEFEYEHVVWPGDKVIFSPDAGEEVIFEQDVLLCMREDDVLAVIDEPTNKETHA